MRNNPWQQNNLSLLSEKRPGPKATESSQEPSASLLLRQSSRTYSIGHRQLATPIELQTRDGRRCWQSTILRHIPATHLVRWLSGRKQRFAKAPYSKRVPRVRIPPSPRLPSRNFTNNLLLALCTPQRRFERRSTGGARHAPGFKSRHCGI